MKISSLRSLHVFICYEQVLPVALSLLASFMSAITILGFPAEVYIYGTQFWMWTLSFCLMIPLAAYVFIPVFYRLKLTSSFEV